MCGIFGLLPNNLKEERDKSQDILITLLKLSESRGHDASGIALLTDNDLIVYKRILPAREIVKTNEFKELVNLYLPKCSVIIGHARMETNGSYFNSNNNQPVVKDGCITIHNGIIVNDNQLWERFNVLKREYEVDTEIINSLLRYFINSGENLIDSADKTFKLLEGSYSTATIFNDLNSLLLATNTGSLYMLTDKNNDILSFASEKYFLEKVKERYFATSTRIRQLTPPKILPIKLGDSLSSSRTIKIITGGDEDKKRSNRTISISKASELSEVKKVISNEYQRNYEKISKLRRCTKCILPETMPFIEFDENGVCNYCRNYSPMDIKDPKNLEKITQKYRKNNGETDCIVTFSGGRDSSYGLYYIKDVLKMNPVAFSYDWGMLTDLGRRNQARMTGELEVEHVLISADIRKKRENIKKNVEAWLKKPNLGTVPLFMAGDKQYFYYANMLKKQMGVDLVILCENPMEKTDFKSGYCGIKPEKPTGKKFYALSIKNTFKLMFYYGKEYLSNPAYINRSIFDSIWAFQSYYFIPHDFLSLYTYIRWEEKNVENTLKKYNWEIAKDTDTTWRIGDGTAAFYNYIYYTMAGFSENDTFRSNQIREGDVTRSEALKITERDNKPRIDTLKWYTDTINVDFLSTIKTINSAPKLYS